MQWGSKSLGLPSYIMLWCCMLSCFPGCVGGLLQKEGRVRMGLLVWWWMLWFGCGTLEFSVQAIVTIVTVEDLDRIFIAMFLHVYSPVLGHIKMQQRAKVYAVASNPCILWLVTSGGDTAHILEAGATWHWKGCNFVAVSYWLVCIIHAGSLPALMLTAAIWQGQYR